MKTKITNLEGGLKMTFKKISIVCLLIIFTGAMLGACGLPEEDAEEFDEDMEDPFEQPDVDFEDPVEEEDDAEDEDDFEDPVEEEDEFDDFDGGF